MNRACQHYKIRDVVDDYVIALCWANFRLRLPLKTASRQSPADRRAHPGHHETHPPIAGPDIGKGRDPHNRQLVHCFEITCTGCEVTRTPREFIGKLTY